MRTLLALWLSVLLALGVASPARAAGPTAGNPPPAVVLQPGAEAPDVPGGWVRVERAGLTIAGPPEAEPALRALADHATAALPRLARELGVPIGGRIHAVLAPDEALFHSLQPGRPPTWADATAWPGHGWIFLRAPEARGGTARPLTQVLDHELVHILLGRAFAPAPVPAWLQEGTAQVLAQEAGPELPSRLRRALATTGGGLHLQDLVRGFPADPHRADLAYALSADFVHWLRRSFGDAALRNLIAAGAAGRGLPLALYDVTGLDVASLDARWQDALPSVASSWLEPQVLEGGLWGLAATAVAGVGSLRLLSRRRRTLRTREESAAVHRLAREILSRQRSLTS